MRKFMLLCIVSLTLVAAANNNFRLIHSDAGSATIEYNFGDPVYKEVIINNQVYYKLSAKGCVPVFNAGFPEVLRSSVSIAVPQGCEPVIEILSADYTELNNTSLVPSKGSLKRNINPNEVPYSFGSAYSVNNFTRRGPLR